MKNIKLICLDVDGTMTDGQIYYDSLGNELKSFNVKDGMVISQAISMGIEFAVITGRTSNIVSNRANELGIKMVYQGIKNKKKLIKSVLNEKQYDVEEVLFIGDDINDLSSMNYCRYSACPADACQEVKSIADMVSSHKGGKGAIREIVEKVLRDKGKWNIIIKNFEFKAQ